MPRRKVDSKGDAVGRTNGSAAVADGGNTSSLAGVSSVPPKSQRYGTALEALQLLCIDDTGWIRIVPQQLGKTTYFKWKWTRGRYAGSYVMYRCDDQDYGRALWGLLEKVGAVYDGRSRPVPDTPYE